MLTGSKMLIFYSFSNLNIFFIISLLSLLLSYILLQEGNGNRSAITLWVGQIAGDQTFNYVIVFVNIPELPQLVKT